MGILKLRKMIMGYLLLATVFYVLVRCGTDVYLALREEAENKIYRELNEKEELAKPCTSL